MQFINYIKFSKQQSGLNFFASKSGDCGLKGNVSLWRRRNLYSVFSISVFRINPTNKFISGSASLFAAILQNWAGIIFTQTHHPSPFHLQLGIGSLFHCTKYHIRVGWGDVFRWTTLSPMIDAMCPGEAIGSRRISVC